MSKAVKYNTSSKRSSSSGNGWEERGGYMNAKRTKLKSQFSDHDESTVQKTAIFNGVAIHVNGYTDPTSDELKRLMQIHGGTYVHFYRKTAVTHIIATSLPTSKINKLTDEKVVKPQWITESVKAGRLLPFQDYVLFKPKWQDEKSIKSNLTVTPSATISAAMETSSKSHATASDPRFLEEFYSNSRLHHISSWGAECKAYVLHLQTEKTSYPGKEKLLHLQPGDCSEEENFSAAQCIMHIDMDCFFVSVGLLKRKHLKGLPVAVTHSKGKGQSHERAEEDLIFENSYWENKYGQSAGDLENARKPSLNSMAEIASCSYEARQAGVKNGMFFGKAKDICPDLVPIPYDYDEYQRISHLLYDIIASYTHDIEAVSCDEMLVNLTSLLNATQLSPMKITSVIREEILEKSGCNASAGIGPNMLLARMATKKAKPNGQFLIPNVAAGQEFLAERPVKDLPGVGWSIAKKLASMSVEKCSDLQQIPLTTLQDNFGQKTGKQLKSFSLGQDERTLTSQKERKSVSAEVNYGIRFTQDSDLSSFLSQLSEELHNRLANLNTKGKTITLKLKVRHKDAPVETAKFMGHGVCDSITKSVTLPLATDNAEVIMREAMAVIRQLHVPVSDLRGIGIQISRLESSIVAASATPSILQFTTKCLQKTTPAAEPHQTQDPQNPESSTDNPPSPSLPPLPSLLSPANPANCTPKASRPNLDQSLPTPSQIDPTFLAALPPEIRSEVVTACTSAKNSRNQVSSPKSKPAFTLPQPKKNSSPGKSPGKRFTNKSPRFKKTSNKAAIKNSSKSTASVTKSVSKELQYEKNDSSVAKATVRTDDDDVISLCGAVSLEEVKRLLGEWVQYSEVPQEEDLLRFITYMEQLSLKKNLEKMYYVFLYFRRVVLKSGNPRWKECFNEVQYQLQSIVKAQYGHPLKLPD